MEDKEEASSVGLVTLPERPEEKTLCDNCSTPFTIVKQDCPHWDTCDSPLCPLDATSLEHGVYYGDEDVCKRRDFAGLPWVKAQRAIAKLGLGVDDGFFTVAMLSAVKQPRPGLKGLNPDIEFSESRKAERRWIRDKTEGRVIANGIPKGHRVSREKSGNLPKMPAYASSAGRGAK